MPTQPGPDPRACLGERHTRYHDLLAEPVPPKVRKAAWTDRATLWAAVADGADRTIRDLAGIAEYSRLTCLHLAGSAVDDLSPLPELPGLQLVWLRVTATADLRPLLSCEGLKRVNIEGGIEELHWGEGEIQFRVWSQFDGESDEFHIRSLAGIEALRNLRILTVVPIDSLPADQVAALRAAGLTVDGPR